MNEQANDPQTPNEESPKFRANVNDIANKVVGGNKTVGIIVAICMVVIGILIFATPVAAAVGLGYLITIGFIIFGVFEIFAYFRTPADHRNGWTLANGIIFTLIGILILIEALGARWGKLDMLAVFSFIIGFFALFSGITQISSYGAFKNSKNSASGWYLASGIINLILGILIICAPIAGWFTIQFIFGIYLIVGGIALFAEACSGKLAHKK
ncbi:MAG: DUF308 domain-containing protein [Christensenella sp.]|uniref:HdeD family acid-resistance protein n=1 Tax=Christensenella sp. TaxID=1935934 RepID=UPI002B21985F|nr:DUF308 domain-containing protein [Christensenella sp.]MEA5004457.1 DUF308 domain-containing protein [Christensenella sp.]